MQIIDSQLHIFGPETESRAADFGQRPMQAADVVAAMDAAGVTRAVVVATSTPTTEIALDAARVYPDRFGVMGSLRLDRPENRELLGSWRERPGMLGIRLSFPPWRQPSWLEDGSADWFWPAAALAGVPVMVWPPDQLDQFARIAEQNPELKIIIDHFGLYVDVMDGGVGAKLGPLLALARHPNVGIKASALPCHSSEQYPYRNLHPYLRRVVEEFGPRRVFWGTDLTRLPCPYKQAVTMFTEELGFLTDDDLDWIMGRGIAGWLRWDQW